MTSFFFDSEMRPPISIVFHQQRGNLCLVLSLAMAIQHEHGTLWRELFVKGIQQHREYIIKKYGYQQEHCDWFEAQVGSPENGFRVPDVLRAVRKFSATTKRPFEFHKCLKATTLRSFFANGSSRCNQSYIVIGRPPTSVEKAYIKKHGKPHRETKEYTVTDKRKRNRTDGLLHLPHQIYFRPGDLHAIAVIFDHGGKGFVLDLAMFRPKVLTAYHLQFSLITESTIHVISV